MTDDSVRPALVWFRDDLRTSDHAALAHAAEAGPTIGLYIAEELPPGETVTDEPGSPPLGPRPLGGAAKWWLHHSLHALADGLAELGIELLVDAGDPREIVPRIAAEIGAVAVTWQRRYAPGSRALDAEIKASLPSVSSHPGHLLNEPWEVATKQGHPYKVFTPFSRAAADNLATAPDGGSDHQVPRLHRRVVSEDTLQATHAAIDALALTPDHPSRPEPDWASEFHRYWTPGEKGAHARLADFIGRLGEGPSPADRKASAADLEYRYATGRDYMALDATSRLSPHLRFGEISPRQA
ncbi:deoxyribodipyrimidine photo-lyase [Corynebacterium xerosis]